MNVRRQRAAGHRENPRYGWHGAVGAYAGAAWWPLGALATALVSLVLCLLAWPDSMLGAFVNVGIVVMIVLWRVGLGLIQRG
jgi:hypothetical protein